MTPVPSHRTVGPSSRRPGAGPTEGTTYRYLERLTPEERNRRGAECWAWACATGERREQLRAEYEARWCGGAR